MAVRDLDYFHRSFSGNLAQHPLAGRPPCKVLRSYAIFSVRLARFDCLLGSCELDGLGHCQDLLTAWLVVVVFLGVLSEMGDKLVVGIGAYSERARATGNFFCHASSTLFKQ